MTLIFYMLQMSSSMYSILYLNEKYCDINSKRDRDERNKNGREVNQNRKLGLVPDAEQRRRGREKNKKKVGRERAQDTRSQPVTITARTITAQDHVPPNENQFRLKSLVQVCS